MKDRKKEKRRHLKDEKKHSKHRDDDHHKRRHHDRKKEKRHKDEHDDEVTYLRDNFDDLKNTDKLKKRSQKEAQKNIEPTEVIVIHCQESEQRMVEEEKNAIIKSCETEITEVHSDIKEATPPAYDEVEKISDQKKDEIPIDQIEIKSTWDQKLNQNSQNKDPVDSETSGDEKTGDQLIDTNISNDKKADIVEPELEDDNEGRHDKRYQTFLLLKSDLQKNQKIVQSKIDIKDTADELEELIYEKSKNKIWKKYWSWIDYVSQNIRISSQYPQIIDLIAKKKISLKILLLENHFFRKRWIEILSKVNKGQLDSKRTEEIKKQSLQSKISNNYLLYANIMNSGTASNKEVNKTNFVSKLSSIWSADQWLKPITKLDLYGDFNIPNE